MSIYPKGSYNGADINDKWKHDKYLDPKDSGPAGNGGSRSRKNNKFGDKPERQQPGGPIGNSSYRDNNKGTGKPYRKENKGGKHAKDEYIEKSAIHSNSYNQKRAQNKETNSLDESSSSTSEHPSSSGNIHYTSGKAQTSAGNLGQYQNSQGVQPSQSGKGGYIGMSAGNTAFGGSYQPQQSNGEKNSQKHFETMGNQYNGEQFQGATLNQNGSFREKRENSGKMVMSPTSASSVPGNFSFPGEQQGYRANGGASKQHNGSFNGQGRKDLRENAMGSNGYQQHHQNRSGRPLNEKREMGFSEPEINPEASFYDMRIRHTKLESAWTSQSTGLSPKRSENQAAHKPPVHPQKKVSPPGEHLDGKAKANEFEEASMMPQRTRVESDSNSPDLSHFLFKIKEKNKALSIPIVTHFISF